jgi:hypothetical protein
MTLNGLLIFALEMPFVGYFERKKVQKLKIILWVLLMSLAFMLLINTWAGILISMILFLLREIFAFPFSNTFALSRAPKGMKVVYGFVHNEFYLHISSVRNRV